MSISTQQSFPVRRNTQTSKGKYTMIFPLQTFDYQLSYLKALFDEFDSVNSIEDYGQSHDEVMQKDKNLFDLVLNIINSDGSITRDSLIHLQLLEIGFVYEDVKNIPNSDFPLGLKTRHYSEFMAFLTEIQFVYDNILLLLAKSGIYKVRHVSLESLGGNNICLGVEF